MVEGGDEAGEDGAGGRERAGSSMPSDDDDRVSSWGSRAASSGAGMGACGTYVLLERAARVDVDGQGGGAGRHGRR